MSYRAVATLATAFLIASVTQAQAPSVVRPRFEVASVKPNRANSPVSLGAGNGQAGGRDVTLKMLIGLAWRLQEFQISGGPSWVGSDRFDVEGKTETPGADPDLLRLMLQSLLEDRFRLEVHHATKDAPVYALVVGRNGPKIKSCRDQSPAIDGPAPPGGGPNHGAIRVSSGALAGNAVTLSLFARMLSQRLDRTVIDKTNLTGRFDIKLHWAPDAGEVPYDPGGNRLPPADPSGPSVFAAIQEQLGLKLESARAALDVLIVDQAEKPSEN